MTDPELADATYIEPITPEIVAKIIEKERPDALLPTMGGQTALNTALALDKQGVLAKYGVEMIGANAEAIDKAEDREQFREAMTRIGLATPKSRLAHNREEAHGRAGARRPARHHPPVLHPGRHRRRHRLQPRGVPRDRRARPRRLVAHQVLIEESVLGWKEFEMEVVRDKADNCIIVCSIENVDPMGVHTGDSITVAPALTLTDKEYQSMRNASIAVLREIGVETGGSNVQFAVNPADGRMVVIEMNPRVSRSSALASKATGFPIAKVAAKLAVGYTLDEIENDITGGATPASFEPTIDYVVTKIPRFAFEKFPGAEPTLTTSMKSVGEAMAIGRTFAESLQKALRGLETGFTGLDDIAIDGLGGGDDKNIVRAALGMPTPDRLLKVAQAMRLGVDHDEIYAACRIDPWFLAHPGDRRHRGAGARPRPAGDGRAAARAEGHGLLRRPARQAHRPRRGGGARAAPRPRRAPGLQAHRHLRRRVRLAHALHVLDLRDAASAVAPACEAAPSDRKKAIILGGGPNRIGQGIEFDYCCCHACFALSEVGVETIMVNCNPETVSTDYDTSDRLYFEPLTAEDVLEIIAVEQSKGRLKGVIVQFGGQTPLKLAKPLEAAGVPILGTSPDAIDLAEDRERFQELLDRLDIKQPDSGIARSFAEARDHGARSSATRC